jgi:hypothetical protein
MTDSGTNETTLKIGDLVAEEGGGVYVGKSATTGKDLYAAPADEPEYLTYGEAYEAAAEMRKQPGHENAHVPTLEELNVNLYLNKDRGKLSGTFNTSGSSPASVYRSSAHDISYGAWVQCFGDGSKYLCDRDEERLPLRLVW